jgi:predicted nucleic acid-binding protein
MPGKFIDTNVLIYLASGDTVKADKAERVLDDVGGVISVQVLNEFVNVARRKMRLSWPEIRETLTTLRGILRVEPITTRVHDTGLDIAERYGLSTYDAMIVASALEANCETLWSEYMEDGMVIGGLRLASPFLAAV